MQLNALPQVRKPENSPYVGFEKGSQKREELLAKLDEIRRNNGDVKILPLWINGPVQTKELGNCTPPHDIGRLLAHYCKASPEHVGTAIKTVLRARKKWQSLPWRNRLLIFENAARLLETKYFVEMNAAVMEDLSKNPHEASIDVQEAIDFLKFNCKWAREIYAQQPDNCIDSANTVNFRPLEGFVYAIPPFNFAAIACNLPCAPLIMGNVVVVKPCSDTVYSFHVLLKILLEAGLPKDVLSVVQGNSGTISEIVLEHNELSGVHFTGSTGVFEDIWSQVGLNVGRQKYKGYPRLVGETGGKNPVIVFPDYNACKSAEMIWRGALGYQGQKCSATSRVYVDEKKWPELRQHLIESMRALHTGDVADFSKFMGAVINANARDNINSYINQALLDVEQGKPEEVLIFPSGFTKNSAIGYFVDTALIVTKDPFYRTMEEEIFGPVLTVCVLPNKNYKNNVFDICDKTSKYALTGAVHTNNMYLFEEACMRVRTGNFYNTMTTGAYVGKQPFSGDRKSGTNSKVGGPWNLLNWVSIQSLSFSFKPPLFLPMYLS